MNSLPKKLRLWARLLFTLPLIAIIISCSDSRQPLDKIDVATVLGNADTSGYLVADKIRSFSFPRDHNAHDGFRNEWWYFTGNLTDDKGREFGYQVTFFRIALLPQTSVKSSGSEWYANHIWMGHAAVTDVKSGEHIFVERFSREAVGLAGNTSRPFRVWLEDWSLSEGAANSTWHITVNTEKFDLVLSLVAETKPVLQGNAGLSQKGPEPGNASYYYSIPRWSTSGQLRIRNQKFPITGITWLDREWSTSALGEDQRGWDWFSLHINSGENLMYYQIRNANGEPNAQSAGVWLDMFQNRKDITREQIQLDPVRYWNAKSGERYPVEWRLTYPDAQRQLVVKALVNEQLMDTTVRYWEGAVEVIDAKTGNRVGSGYLEQTGY